MKQLPENKTQDPSPNDPTLSDIFAFGVDESEHTRGAGS